jgi:hypothetical protein
MTPEARVNVPAGIPGTPGIPARTASSVPGSVVRPVPDKADTWLTAGVAQLAGTDIGPIDLAPLSTADTARPPLLNAVTVYAAPNRGAGCQPLRLTGNQRHGGPSTRRHWESDAGHQFWYP